MGLTCFQFDLIVSHLEPDINKLIDLLSTDLREHGLRLVECFSGNIYSIDTDTLVKPVGFQFFGEFIGRKFSLGTIDFSDCIFLCKQMMQLIFKDLCAKDRDEKTEHQDPGNDRDRFGGQKRLLPALLSSFCR